ncbi:peptidylprolyl isomerase [Prolixibacteraceae bacterium JC049]|nr:peptidylprolyl isomerase [Prolixibacteraceae bacterium JC049]
MEIAKNMMVKLSYTLRYDNAQGDIIEQTNDENPLQFMYGAGLMLPKFEEGLVGKKVGENFELSLISADAYGEVDDNAIVELPKDVFLIDGKFDDEMIKEGNSVPMMSSDGRRLTGQILKVGDDIVKVDFNHPLAGADLFFAGEVLEVREATDEEIAEIFSAAGGCGSGGCGCDSPEDNAGCGSGSCGC